MEPEINSIATTAVRILRGVEGNKKYSEIYFTPNDSYSDSFLRGHRKGKGLLGIGAPAPDSPIDYLEINITFRPNIFGSEWVGYTVVINNPESQPKLQTIQKWPQSGGQEDISLDVIAQLLPHLAALLALPTSISAPPREAPESMF